ncbi:hypothetical protein JKG47_12070 [Acidithiobacillus sp. MC6.1]|nr:hypothetical protein [Acidithiobacillus sp. MC6.1]
MRYPDNSRQPVSSGQPCANTKASMADNLLGNASILSMARSAPPTQVTSIPADVTGFRQLGMPLPAHRSL